MDFKLKLHLVTIVDSRPEIPAGGPQISWYESVHLMTPGRALIAIGPAKYERVSEMTPNVIDGDFVHVVSMHFKR